MKHSASRRASERSAAVSNQCGFVSMTTCIISTAAAISSTPGIALSTVYTYWIGIIHPTAKVAGGDAERDREAGIITSVVRVPITSAVRTLLSAR
jgi:hypothetical protein